MSSAQAKEQYLKQLADILSGVNQTKFKLGSKCTDAKIKRENLTRILKMLNDSHRKYALALKKFKTECKRNELLQVRIQERNATDVTDTLAASVDSITLSS